MRFTRPIAVALCAVAAPAFAQPAPPAPPAPVAPPATASPEIARAAMGQRLAAGFAKYDTGTKGYLTAAEFGAMWTGEQGGKADPAQSAAIFARADGDGDARLTLAEFTAFVTTQVAERRGGDAARGGGPRGDMAARMAQAWATADVGAKGYLTYDEFVGMMGSMRPGGGRGGNAARGEGTAGSGGAGSERARRAPDAARIAQFAKMIFAGADANHDERLTQDEAKAYFATMQGQWRGRGGDRGGAGGSSGAGGTPDGEGG